MAVIRASIHSRAWAWDISEIGVRLGVEHSLADLPHHFTLSLFKDCRVQRDCEVVWSDTQV